MGSMADNRKTTIERAFDLAASGEVDTVDAIRRQLRAEGYDQRQIEGATLRNQLKGIITRALVEQERRRDHEPR